MKLVGIAMVRNEADIIEPFVRHNLAQLDALLIADHRSDDGTAGLLARLQAEGLPIEVQPEHGRAYQQGSVMTRLMRAAAARGADYVLPLDADEFIGCDAGSVRAMLAQQPPGAALSVPWRTYVPCPDDCSEEPDPVRRITHRLATEVHPMYKVVVPARMAADPELSLNAGSHDLVLNCTGKALRSLRRDHPLFIAHYPVRSAQQLLAKAVRGWLAVLQKADRVPGEAYQWSRLYRRVGEERPLDREELMRLAMDYARFDEPADVVPALDYAPFAVSAVCRYATGTAVPGLTALLAREAEAMAQQLGSLARETGKSPPASIATGSPSPYQRLYGWWYKRRHGLR